MYVLYDVCVFVAQEEVIRNLTCSDTSAPANTWPPRSKPLPILIRGEEGVSYRHRSEGTEDPT